LINHSFKITYDSRNSIMLQQINKNVFKSPEDLQANYIRIWQYLKLKSSVLSIPAPKFVGESPFYIDENNEYWRAFEYIENTQAFSIAQNPNQAELTSVTFANFTSALNDFEPGLLKIVIPCFHDLSFRYSQFEESLNSGLTERLNRSDELVSQLIKKAHYRNFYERIVNSDQFPERVMHHDAKISNILFDRKTHTVICPVDFDTTMPGYFFSDLGDMIRSMACNEDENNTNFNSIQIRQDFYNAIIKGYLTVMNNVLTKAELKYIHYSGLLIIYMQALRFLTDYLNGDTYYQVNYSEQNFDRAKNQFMLLQNLEAFLKEHYQFII